MTTNPTPTAGPVASVERILVPLDFSDASYKALDYSIALARQFDAKITLLHVVLVSYMAGEYGPIDLPELEAQLTTAARTKLDTVAREKVPAGLVEGTLIRVGPAVYEIATTARDIKADLLIISTHGYTGLKRVLLGSVAENVVRQAPCPVLVVREKEHEFIHN
jgi:nucleotide-binding universal stress UspA family protein